MSATLEELNEIAHQWSKQIKSEVVEGRTAIGGGSAPGQTLPTKRLKITANKSAESIAEALRRHGPPIIGRIEDDHLFLDPRTVLPEEHQTVAKRSQFTHLISTPLTRYLRDPNRDSQWKWFNFQS